MKRDILKRIKAGTIKTNFEIFPETVKGFTRAPQTVSDEATSANFNYASYTRDNDLGFVTVEDLAAGVQQVRKVDLVKPEGSFPKTAVPSERIW